jgi:hypothetical protein
MVVGLEQDPSLVSVVSTAFGSMHDREWLPKGFETHNGAEIAKQSETPRSLVFNFIYTGRSTVQTFQTVDVL